jgi:hypothetical protein
MMIIVLTLDVVSREVGMPRRSLPCLAGKETYQKSRLDPNPDKSIIFVRHR